MIKLLSDNDTTYKSNVRYASGDRNGSVYTISNVLYLVSSICIDIVRL